MASPTLDTTNKSRAKTGVELAEVVRRFGPKYTAIHGPTMMPSQKRAIEDIAACCTGQLGGRLYRCDDCDEVFWRFHCCRNRACPKCHEKQTRHWLEKRQAELLPCCYFHTIVTVPSELRKTFLRHQKLMYSLLMKVSAEAVKELCAEERHLGGLPGILAVLHTWNGQLLFHPHLHMLITAGGISHHGQRWESVRGEFLVPVKLLSRKIAAKFRDALEKQDPTLFKTIEDSVWRREWVSFCKHYGRGNDAVLRYLSRYVFRTAISNARILSINNTHVSFRYKVRTTDRWRTLELEGVEFLRRFLLHVLPRRFHKVRYYGLWHHSKRKFSNRAWLLLILETRAEPLGSLKVAELIEISPNSAEIADGNHDINQNDQDTHKPCCPRCQSPRTTFLAEWPRFAP